MSAITIPRGFKVLPLPISQLSLPAVLKCGQSFRWAAFPLLPPEDAVTVPAALEPTHEYRFCLKDRVVCLQQSPDALFYRSIFKNTHETASSSTDVENKEAETVAFIRDYFQLDTDLLALYDEWSASDPVFRSLRGRFSGIRMLRQDPWECLISFICSSNNNISRISKMVQNLCTHFSPALLSLPDPLSSSSSSSPELPVPEYHPFPPPSALASPSVSSKLRTLGFGYRADFIQKTAAMLIESHGSDDAVFSFLEGLRSTDAESARIELLKLMGVGRKVADCILLMSLDKMEVVPVDTHVYQIAVKHYGMRGSSGGKIPMTPKLYDDVNAKLAKIWGAYAGWAHSILFTADLKSFSTYGLPTPTPSASPVKSSRGSRASSSAPLDSPSPRKKRKQAMTQDDSKLAITMEETKVESEVTVKIEETLPDGSLAERVKRRRRVAVTTEVVKEW